MCVELLFCFVGLTFDNNDEAYDFQVCKWMIANKVTDIQPHPPAANHVRFLQGLGAIPPSAFCSPKNAHLMTDYIRFNFAKVIIVGLLITGCDVDLVV